jgi:EAL domain-containing protein (putative c-di-GMP-specific phosphodiesterase class I)/CheY-like chemotaxis protein
MSAELRDALAAREFVLHYQPKVELATGQVVGCEALLRWQHPQRGLVMPGEFLDAAEASDMILELGEWVLRTGCAQIVAWHDAGAPAVALAVNLSGRQFRDERLPERVASALRDTGLRPPALELDLTEAIVMEDAANFVTRLAALKALGIRLSLDDFGTGYSNLSYLKRFPLDFLKVDRSFVQDVTTNPDDAAIVRAVISLGHSLGLAVVAEGVETEAQVEWLRRERCEQIQGYVFSRPLPAAQFEALLRSRKGLPSRGTGAQDGKTLLIVDDDAGVAASVVRVLRRDGYHILTAPHATDALDLMALNVVHVVIADHRMPAMTGAELLGKVKLLYPDTVRILFSGYIEIEALTEAVNRGAIYRFLLKPWDDETLRESVRQAFHHYWLTHTLKERTG